MGQSRSYGVDGGAVKLVVVNDSPFWYIRDIEDFFDSPNQGLCSVRKER